VIAQCSQLFIEFANVAALIVADPQIYDDGLLYNDAYFELVFDGLYASIHLNTGVPPTPELFHIVLRSGSIINGTAQLLPVIGELHFIQNEIVNFVRP